MQLTNNTNLIFAHVPKCAGSSVVSTIREYMPGIFPIRWGHIDQNWNEFIKSDSKNKFVYGHLRDRHLSILEETKKDYRLITFLRHPVDRLISVYRYNASPASPNYKQFIEKHSNFEEWVMNFPANDVASFTVGEVENSKQYVDTMLKRFDFIGFQESYGRDISRLKRLLGFPDDQKEKRENETIDTQYNDFRVDDRLRGLIEERNQMDCDAFYELIKLFP